MLDLKLPYGLQDGELVSIDEVEGGLECNCVCPGCQKQLIARKGSINVHHFAHYEAPDCGYGIESALHKLCKSYFLSKTHFVTPPVYFHRSSFMVYGKQEITIDSIEFEKQLEDIRPDILIVSKGKKLLVEIAVSHKVDSFKANKIRSLGIATIEIDARRILANRSVKRDFGLGPKSLLPTDIINGIANKYWVYNPKLLKIKSILREKCAELKHLKSFPISENYGRIQELMGYENCPIQKRVSTAKLNKGISYARFDDCNHCIFNVSYDNFSSISCIGHFKDNFYSLIKQFS